MLNRSGRGLFTCMMALLLGACARHTSQTFAPERLPFHADSLRTTVVAPGMLHHFVYSAEGPWAIQLLEVHRDACWTLRAGKGVSGAMGRMTTSAILDTLRAHGDAVYAGVNADFFNLANGFPASVLVEQGRMFAGPSPRPALLVDSTGAPTIGTLSVAGSVAIGSAPLLRLAAWNRLVGDGLAVLDDAYGFASDTGSARIEVGLRGPGPYVVTFVDSLPAASPVPRGGLVLVLGPLANSTARSALGSLRLGDTVRISRGLVPGRPRDAVGGWPVILRDGVIAGAVDSGATFGPVRHPRTAIGLADFGRTIWIAVVDGRQKPWSDGMTLRELARVFQSLGATDALNLDGGGSSAFVSVDPDAAHVLRVRNRPSDKGGERTVGDALAVVKGC